jgi:hypothetical protein
VICGSESSPLNQRKLFVVLDAGTRLGLALLQADISVRLFFYFPRRLELQTLARAPRGILGVHCLDAKRMVFNLASVSAVEEPSARTGHAYQASTRRAVNRKLIDRRSRRTLLLGTRNEKEATSFPSHRDK